MGAVRTYSVVGTNLTVVNAVVTLVWLNPPAAPARAIEIVRVWVSQAGMATTGQQRIQLNTQVTAFPTVVSTTPQSHNRGDTTASVLVGGTGAAGTAGVNASAEGAGAKTVLIPDVFGFSGYVWVPTDEERIVLPAGLASGFGVHLPAVPAVLTGWHCGVTYKEL